MSRLTRVPLRLRITLGFILATGVVLVALSLFLHQQLAIELDNSLRAGLTSRAGDLAAQVRRGGPDTVAGNELVERGDDIVQIVSSDGGVVSGATGFEDDALLSRDQIAAASAGPILIERTRVANDDGPVALVAAPAGGRVVVVGAALEERDEALQDLDGLLLLGVPIALALAALTGFVVAGGALRPIERIRARAAAIGAGELSERLPVPTAQDEARRLAETLNAMLERLELSFARERSFVADASHELRTPLSRLKVELELADADGRTIPELREAVRSAAGDVDALARLADDLLVLARADEGRLPVRTEDVPLAELLERFGSVDCPADLVVVADPVRLQQAVGNLADNALRHGGGLVQLQAETVGDWVRVHALDAGSGVPRAMWGAAFDRFTRADAAREGGGAGLGLAIVAAIATAHGGSTGIADRAGGGADVWFSVPLRRAPAPPRGSSPVVSGRVG